MRLEPYQYRPATPPNSEAPVIHPDSNHSRNTSGSSVWSRNSSPDSVHTHATTPSRSPIKPVGPTLLPRIRTQDQNIEPSLKLAKTHRRALSSAVNPPGQSRPSRPTVQRSTTTPPECVSVLSPDSAASTAGLWAISTLNPPISPSSSETRRPGHTRASSASVIDDNILRRYGYPTYRSRPQYVSRAPEYTPSIVPGISTFVPPPLTKLAQSQDLAHELQYVNKDDPLTQLTQYLTGPNPVVNLVPNPAVDLDPNENILGKGQQKHSWQDIRNLEVWKGFDLKTMNAIPDLNNILHVDIRAAALPIPVIPQSRLRPKTESQLTDIYRDLYAAKVNTALKISQGSKRHMSIRAETTEDGPVFMANYPDEFDESTIGKVNSRVVGLVISYDRWNTEMSRDDKHQKSYLTALAHLHYCMREHGCRYGFIMTEIELVCVRAGTESFFCFGSLELAPTVELRTQEGWTACMALWYLHMLAKETPLLDQCGWKLEVELPRKMTRKMQKKKHRRIPMLRNRVERKVNLARRRVMLGDPWNKKEEVSREMETII